MVTVCSSTSCLPVMYTVCFQGQVIDLFAVGEKFVKSTLSGQTPAKIAFKCSTGADPLVTMGFFGVETNVYIVG